MPTLKKKWDRFLEYSVALAAGLVMTFGALLLLLAVGCAVVLTKILEFIK
jgi:hypothetical protein